MRMGDVQRSAAAMRTALIGHPMVEFNAPVLCGPAPNPGRMVELVDVEGKHLHVVWDDGLILDTQLSRRTNWYVFRKGGPWYQQGERVSAQIATDDFVAVCFDAADVETYRPPDRTRHPGSGRLGPHLARPDADLDEVYARLVNYPDPERRVRDVLIDAHVMRGVGNVFRCEVLWAIQLSPWAHIGDLTENDAKLIVQTATEVVRANVNRLRRSTTRATTQGLAVYGRTGQGCIRCAESIESVRTSGDGRMLFWCPGCQFRLDRRQSVDLQSMDPHPAATKYLNDLERARRGGDDDLMTSFDRGIA